MGATMGRPERSGMEASDRQLKRVLSRSQLLMLPFRRSADRYLAN